MLIESSHELSLKLRSSSLPILFPRWLISGRSFRANWRERIDRSLPSTRENFPCSPLAHVYSFLRYSRCAHMENPIRRVETRKTCSSHCIWDLARRNASRMRIFRPASRVHACTALRETLACAFR